LRLEFSVLEGRLAVCRLDPGSPIPAWAAGGPFFSITRTGEETSVVCDQSRVPEGTRCEKGWRSFKLQGPFDLSAVGVLASFAPALSAAGISIFVIGTFDTDYLLVRDSDLDRAVAALEGAGHQVGPSD